MPHINPDTLKPSDKLKDLVTRCRLDDEELHRHAADGNVEALRRRAQVMVQNADHKQSGWARMLLSSIDNLDRREHWSTPEERIARHNAKQACEYLDPSTLRG